MLAATTVTTARALFTGSCTLAIDAQWPEGIKYPPNAGAHGSAGWGVTSTVRFRIRHLLALLLAFLALAAGTWSPAHADGSTIRVIVKDQVTEAGKQTKVPLPNVTATVTDSTGAVIGTAVTDAKGVADIKIPGPGDFTITLDEKSLPAGKALTAETPAVRNLKKDDFITQTVVVNYFTGQAKRNTTGWFSRLAQRGVDGTRLGLILAMCSVGLSLIFGTTGLTNFAHGEMVTFGGLVTFLFSVSWSLPFLITAPIVVVLGGLFGLAFELCVFGPLRRRGIGLVSQLVVTVGLAIFLQNFFLYRFGGRTKAFKAFANQPAHHWGPILITSRDLTSSILSLTILVCVALALQRSRLGKATRAVSDNPDLASSTGIDSQKIIRIVWFIGGALAAFGGIVRGLDQGVGPQMGADLLFLMFAGITLGGLGSAFGALLGGFIVGLFVEVCTLFGVPSELSKVPALLVLILLLLVRPQGILGRRERVG
jgi:branched-chain amino acid transport system permease protein